MGQAKLKKQLMERTWGVSVHRLVILEWLAEGDTPTGSNLAAYLRVKLRDMPIDLVKCRSKEDVLDGIRRAMKETATKGNPILHIEAHGYGEEEKGPGLGFKGPGLVGEEEIPWEELIPLFRELNFATAFNLVVVGAGCKTQYLARATSFALPAPFLLLVAFEDLVTPDDLEWTLMNLYGALFRDRLSLEQAVDKALEATKRVTGLKGISMLRIIFNAVKQVVDEDMSGTLNVDGYMKVVGTTALQRQGNPLRPSEYQEVSRQHTEKVVHRVIDRLLALQRLPQNAARFGLQAGRLIRDIRRGHMPVDLGIGRSDFGE